MNVLFCALDKKEFHRPQVALMLIKFGENLKLSIRELIK